MPKFLLLVAKCSLDELVVLLGDAVEAQAHRNNFGRSSRHLRHIDDTNCTRKSRSALHPVGQTAHHNSGIWFSSQVPFNSPFGNVEADVRGIASVMNKKRGPVIHLTGPEFREEVLTLETD